MTTFKVDSLTVPTGAALSTPPAGVVGLYAKVDKKLYQKDDAGLETLLAGGVGGVTYPLLAPDGTASAPSYAFASQPTTGFYYSGGMIGMAAGTRVVSIAPQGLLVDCGILVIRDVGGGVLPGITLVPDDNHVLAQRNATYAQTHRLYGTYTNASNYERLSLSAIAIQNEQAGTGVARNLTVTAASLLVLGSGGSSRWGVLETDGNLFTFSDNATDIGQNGSNRPRSLYLGSRLVVGQATVTYSASMTPDAALGNQFIITVTNATAFTINAPTNPTTGQMITIRIRNTTGGALGTATWNAVFKLTAWTQPATATSKAISFWYNGTNWVETARTTVDVPN